MYRYTTIWCLLILASCASVRLGHPKIDHCQATHQAQILCFTITGARVETWQDRIQREIDWELAQVFE